MSKKLVTSPLLSNPWTRGESRVSPGADQTRLSPRVQQARRTVFFFTLFLALTGAACKGKHNLAAIQNEEPDPGPRLVSNLRMNDTAAAAQLLNGFYPIEGGAWRWTAGKFSALLRTPPGSAQSGATLNFSFTIPDVV